MKISTFVGPNNQEYMVLTSPWLPRDSVYLLPRGSIAYAKLRPPTPLEEIEKKLRPYRGSWCWYKPWTW